MILKEDTDLACLMLSGSEFHKRTACTVKEFSTKEEVCTGVINERLLLERK